MEIQKILQSSSLKGDLKLPVYLEFFETKLKAKIWKH